MTVDAAERKSCCTAAYASVAAQFLFGDSLHPGGPALTDELVDALDVSPGDVAADIASGPGASAIRLARATGCAVIGIDLAWTSSTRATAAAQEAGLSGTVHFACADAEALPLGDASVDGVLCECALCLFADKAAAAREIARVLKPGGRLALSDVVVEPARLLAVLRTLDAYVACIADARPLDETATILRAAGLTIETAQRRDAAVAQILERTSARLRFARAVGGGPIGPLIDRADVLVDAARAAVREGSLGYGVVIARR